MGQAQEEVAAASAILNASIEPAPQTEVEEAKAILNGEDTDNDSTLQTTEEGVVEEGQIVEDNDEPEDVDTEDSQPDEGSFPSDLSSLADAIDVDISDLYNVKIKLADGEEPKSISELKNGFQEATRNAERLEATIAEQKSALEGAQQSGQINTQLNAAEMKLMSQHEALVAEYNQTDWATLEATDPGSAALLKQQFQEAGGIVHQERLKLQQAQGVHRQERMGVAAQKVMQIIPTWSDSDLRVKQTKAIDALLVGEGMPRNQINTLADPISIKLLDELVTLRAKFAQAEDSVEKVRRVPKTIHGGARRKSNPNKKTDALVNKARNTTNHQGKRQAELDAVKSILNGGG